MDLSKKVQVDWSISKNNNFEQVLYRFRRYLEGLGHSNATIDGYLGNLKRYLVFSRSDRPTMKDWQSFNESLHDRKLGRSTLNQYSYAVRAYYAMLGESLPIKRLQPHNEIPYFFDEDDVIKIFNATNNLKHLAMLETLFYAHLRCSELIMLNDEDLDLKNLTVRVRGKGGRIALAYLHPECLDTLKRYFMIRPPLKIDGKTPVFYTENGNRWQRTEVSRMFERYKKRANITKPGGIHVFGRHTPASIMIKNGCDILTIKDLLRHKDITTTARYLHVSEQTCRLKQCKFLRL
jgi:site-specific recombinase XerD